MPVAYGPRCAKCGMPRFRVVNRVRVAVDCACTGAAPATGKAPWHGPDDVHYSAIKKPTIKELLRRRPRAKP